MISRGLRNNNPLNLDRTSVVWQGQADDQSSDPRFVVFKTPEYGIRAGAKVLLTYQNHDGCKTIRQIIGRFAPPGENNTAAYITAICSATGYGPDDEINLDTVATMKPFLIGVIIHEEGSNPYTDAQILQGIQMAGVSDAKPPPLMSTNTFKAQVGTGVAVVSAGAAHLSQYAPTVKGWADQLGDYAGVPVVQHAQTVFLTVGAGLVGLGILSQILKQKAA
jgi:hypothetical protein